MPEELQTEKAVVLTRSCPAHSEVCKQSEQPSPHVLLTLPVVGLQPFDPGVALPGAAGVAVGAELL